MHIKKLENIFNIKKGDIISIVGSGGKTSLLFMLANSLKKNYNVLVTTSTKIYKPNYNDCDYLYTDLKSYFKNKLFVNNAVTVISKSINKDSNKLIGIDNNDLNNIYKDFDVVLIESDGSKKMSLKGWKSYEPCILNKTNKTIGIIPIDNLDKKVNRDFIYGYEEFMKLTDNADYINFEIIGRICSKASGIFKNSMGELYLYLNKVDTEEDKIKAMNLSDYLEKNVIGYPYNFKICYGSIKKGNYYEN
ncbi:MAG: selenium cofactor biosynthesis protein YqeC [Tissierellia bacterium]|nr:selenium cofactor biosynthesis protein YqeC [Tissierellia bacterium]MDD4779345.1 selenium cofactor biosynthesis protein YqeC [Tissierellia bacterium]